MAMDLQKIRVRKDLERMVINYFLRGEITEDQSARICDFIDNAIGGGDYPQPCHNKGRAVIPFPTSYTGPGQKEDPEAKAERTARERALSEIYAPYGDPLPEGVQDFRETLQRDGLVLICYQKLTSREGAFFNVLWAQSNNANRRRLTEWSGAVREEDIPYVLPLDAEYSHSYHEKLQEIYTVRVAPETILIGPLSDFYVYIQSLKDANLKNNFDYVFNFTAEKRNRFLTKNKELIDLKLSMRVINPLNDRGIHTVKELQKITVHELRKIRSLGETSVNETVSLLKKAGITLQEDQENYV